MVLRPWEGPTVVIRQNLEVVPVGTRRLVQYEDYLQLAADTRWFRLEYEKTRRSNSKPFEDMSHPAVTSTREQTQFSRPSQSYRATLAPLAPP